MKDAVRYGISDHNTDSEFKSSLEDDIYGAYLELSEFKLFYSTFLLLSLHYQRNKN